MSLYSVGVKEIMMSVPSWPTGGSTPFVGYTVNSYGESGVKEAVKLAYDCGNRLLDYAFLSGEEQYIPE